MLLTGGVAKHIVQEAFLHQTPKAGLSFASGINVGRLRAAHSTGLSNGTHASSESKELLVQFLGEPVNLGSLGKPPTVLLFSDGDK